MNMHNISSTARRFVKVVLVLLVGVSLLGTPVFASWSNTNLGHGWTGVISGSAESSDNLTVSLTLNTSGCSSNCVAYIHVAWLDNGGSPACTPTDTLMNTWTPLTQQSDGSGIDAGKLFYSAAPTVGAVDVFTCNANRPSITVAFASGAAASPFDKQNGAIGNATSVQTGTTGTLTVANELLLVSCSFNNNASDSTVDTGFTRVDGSFTTAGVISNQLSYLTQAGTGAVNPTCSNVFSGQNMSATVATFKPVAAVTTRARVIGGKGRVF